MSPSYCIVIMRGSTRCPRCSRILLFAPHVHMEIEDAAKAVTEGRVFETYHRPAGIPNMIIRSLVFMSDMGAFELFACDGAVRTC